MTITEKKKKRSKTVTILFESFSDTADVCSLRRFEVFQFSAMTSPCNLPRTKHPFQSFFKLRADGQVDEEITGGVDGRHQVCQGHGCVEGVAQSSCGGKLGQEVPEERMRHGR